MASISCSSGAFELLLHSENENCAKPIFATAGVRRHQPVRRAVCPPGRLPVGRADSGQRNLAEWLVRLLRRGNAYRAISFEREAYDNQRDANYLSHRRHFAWRHYLGAGNRAHRKNKKHPI